ncbi:hypothetical protein CDD82_6591 [Ophiocordyceps australis]|uniref:DNA-directed RNA polymerase III subunit RPC9 n=1 Tax=Ophiocordyceps australis TaxID=1399860 RepID=A0A2C5YRB4_9HYPO|nr:hypothetical protein CDD82_6591 [Ophiocordyceps australis]
MKIIESQSAVLTNYEVWQHLVAQKQRYHCSKRRGPANLETVVREVLSWMRTRPGPLAQEPATYSNECIAQLLERLRRYTLSKGEVLVILNLRPTSVVALNTIVDDLGERFSEEQQEEIVAMIVEVLGQFEQDQGTDHAMDTAAG